MRKDNPDFFKGHKFHVQVSSFQKFDNILECFDQITYLECSEFHLDKKYSKILNTVEILHIHIPNMHPRYDRYTLFPDNVPKMEKIKYVRLDILTLRLN